MPTEAAVACSSHFSIITLMRNTAEITCFHLTFPCFLKDVNKAVISRFPSSLKQTILTAKSIVIATGGRPKYPTSVSVIP